MKKFQDISDLPNTLLKRIEQCATSDELGDYFVDNRAVFHKRCTLDYSESRYKRRVSTLKSSQKPVDEDQPRNSRRNVATHNFTGLCFFCDLGVSVGVLHSCRTLYLDIRERKIAQEIGDKKLTAKLSEGDMVATEAKYHKNCLSKFYNQYRDYNNKKTAETRRIEQIKGIAFAEVVNFIEDTIEISSDEEVPVFKLTDLEDMYSKKMLYHGATADEADYVHVTRFKAEILNHLPCLVESKNGKSILLTLDTEMGRALFEACQNTSTDDGIILAKAAGIIRRNLLLKEEVFNGDISREKQAQSVHVSLVNLITLIMEGGSIASKRSEHSVTIATNLSQLIRFNSVRNQRKETVAYICHSKDNEPPLPVLVGLMVHLRTRKKALVNALASEGLCINYSRVKCIQRCTSNQLIKTYISQGMVCPPSLKQDIFTTSAIDNLDYNPSSVTSKDSVHITSISIFQHPTVPITKEPFRMENSTELVTSRYHLPTNKTNEGR